jgi:parallel beta-helix repeat protein
MISRPAFCVCLLACLTCAVASANTWTVDLDGTGDFTSVQAAIVAAAESDEIVVHDGTYFENIDFLGKNIFLHSDHGPAVTILDGSTGQPGQGSCVTFASGEAATARLEAFTITGGTGTTYRGTLENRLPSPLVGGGIYCGNASPTIRDCQVRQNSAEYAAGLFLDHASPLVTDCTFSWNTALRYGSAIAGPYSSPVISSCVIEYNTIVTEGGGTVHLLAPAVIEYCIFRGNTAPRAAGVNADGPDASVHVSHCIFLDNTAHWLEGGAIRVHEAGQTVIEYCLAAGNTAQSEGGGLVIIESSNVTVSHCTFYGNGAPTGGNGCVEQSNGHISNCIFSESTQGGGLVANGASLVLECNDVWGNSGGNYIGLSDPTGTDGNISENPVFCDPVGGDFALGSDSPCAPDVNPACGLIGVSAVGCGPTPTSTISWGGMKALFRR